MRELRVDESHQGPLKIIRLPSCDPPELKSETPLTLRQYGFHGPGPTRTDETAQEDKSDFVFKDVNEDYEEIQKINIQTEQQVLRSRSNSVYIPGNDSAYIDPSQPVSDQSGPFVRAASPRLKAKKMNDLVESSCRQEEEPAPTLVWKKHGKKGTKGRNVHPYTTDAPSSDAPSSVYLFGNAESEGKTELHSLVSDPYRMNQPGQAQTPLGMQNQNYPSMFEEPGQNSSDNGDGLRQARRRLDNITITRSVPALHETDEPIQQVHMPEYFGGESPLMDGSGQNRRLDMATEAEESKVEVTRSLGFSEHRAHADLEESQEVLPHIQAREARRLRTEEEENLGQEYGTLKSLRETKLSYTKSRDPDDPKSSSIFVKSPLSSNSHTRSQRAARLATDE